MSENTLEAAALEYEWAMRELEGAAKHLQVTANHFRAGEVPRGCAHLIATLGHIKNAESVLERMMVLHAAKSLA
jgi:hypothetical protein